MERELVLEIPNDLQAISEAVDYVVGECADCVARARKLRLNFRVGLTEALSNAMLYGNGADPGKKVRIEVVVAEASVRATVIDEGFGFDTGELPDPTRPENIRKPGGRGIFLMRELCDEVVYNDRGNQVTLVLRFEDPPTSGLEGGATA